MAEDPRLQQSAEIHSRRDLVRWCALFKSNNFFTGLNAAEASNGPCDVDVTEQKRLNEAREAQHPVEEMGTLPQRAAVGHGPRGLQRKRRRLELLHP